MVTCESRNDSKAAVSLKSPTQQGRRLIKPETPELFVQLAHSLTVWKSLLLSSAGQSLFLLGGRLRGIAAVLPDIRSLAYS